MYGLVGGSAQTLSALPLLIWFCETTTRNQLSALVLPYHLMQLQCFGEEKSCLWVEENCVFTEKLLK
jgi:hypothetical protein